MANKKNTKTTTKVATADAVATNSTNNTVDVVATKKENVEVSLVDTDVIEVVSLIPNVSYKDDKSGDEYEWQNVGDAEEMDFATLKNLRRRYKSYFNEMWLKPLDDRVIKHFGLEKVYTNYEHLMKETSYTQSNIDDICEKFSTLPKGLKWTVCDKIKSMVLSGKISNVNIIKKLEAKLNMDLFYLL